MQAFAYFAAINLAILFGVPVVAQDDIGKIIKKLSDDDAEVRSRALEKLVKLGTSARPEIEKAMKAADAQTLNLLGVALRQIAKVERASELRKHSEAIGEKAMWIEKAGFALAAEEEIGARVAPAVFGFVDPPILIATWEDDFDHLNTEIVIARIFSRPTGGGGFRPRAMVRYRALIPRFAGNPHVTLKPDSFAGAKTGTLDEILRLWPTWEQACPILAIQEAILVAKDDACLRATLIEATKSSRRSRRIVALHALRHAFYEDAVEAAIVAIRSDDEKTRKVALCTLRALTGAPKEDPAGWWEENKRDAKKIFKQQFKRHKQRDQMRWSEIPVSLKDQDAKRRILKFLKHQDPRARRDAAMMAAWAGYSEVVPVLRTMAAAPEPELRTAAIRALSKLDPVESTPILKRMLNDEAAVVRTTALSLLGPAEWKSAVKFLADDGEDVRRTAIRIVYEGKQAEPLRQRLRLEKDPKLRAQIAVAVVLLEADSDAAKILIDEVIESSLPHRFDALYALNKVTNGKVFDRMVSATYPEVDQNAGWEETVQAVEKGAGVSVRVRNGRRSLQIVQGFSLSGPRLTPPLLKRFLHFLEDPTDAPGWSFLIEDETVIVLPLDEAVEHWKKWRK